MEIEINIEGKAGRKIGGSEGGKEESRERECEQIDQFQKIQKETNDTK